MVSEEKLSSLLVKIEASDHELIEKFSGLELLSLKMAALGLLNDPDLSIKEMETTNDEWEAGGGEKSQVEANRTAFEYLKTQVK